MVSTLYNIYVDLWAIAPAEQGFRVRAKRIQKTYQTIEHERRRIVMPFCSHSLDDNYFPALVPFLECYYWSIIEQRCVPIESVLERYFYFQIYVFPKSRMLIILKKRNL